MQSCQLTQLTQTFLDQLGKPYIWGGQNPLLGFDCSGLAVFALQAAGMLPQNKDCSAKELYNWLLSHPGRSSREEGAFALYGASIQSISHIAYCLDDRWSVEAHGDETCKNISDAIKWRGGAGAYVRRSLITHRSDLIACLRPVYESLGEEL